MPINLIFGTLIDEDMKAFLHFQIPRDVLVLARKGPTVQITESTIATVVVLWNKLHNQKIKITYMEEIKGHCWEFY
ncbi:hypothetical protein AAZX31_13G073000 [Glycine max]